MADLKLFSPEWCAAAKEAANASDAMYKGFKDPATFTNKMAFTCADRDLVTHMEWEQAKVVHWGGPQYDDDDLWIIITADTATWREAAEGRTEAGLLLMSGKIKFLKGPMSAAIENADAFQNFLLSWNQVPTDWDV